VASRSPRTKRPASSTACRGLRSNAARRNLCFPSNGSQRAHRRIGSHTAPRGRRHWRVRPMSALAFHDSHVIQGEQAVSDRVDTTLQTVLGSCVAACLHDPVRRIGGMNHFLLPDDGHGATCAMPPPRWSDWSTNCSRTAPNAAAAGQAFRWRAHHVEPAGYRAAQRGIGAGLPPNEGIPCKSQSLGGNQARRVRFWPATGRAQQF
jgi:chemotaxis protein CheD